MHVELVRTVTCDGLRLDGAWHTPHSAPSRGVGEGLGAILLHGVAGNFYTSSTFEPLIPILQQLGMPVLAVNTRGHDSVFGASLGNVRRRLGAAYETVDDCRHDIAAWAKLAADREVQKLVLIGHSLGAIKAVYAAAHEPPANLVAVVAVSPPRLSYAAFRNSPESSLFFESMSIAEQMMAEGRRDELFTGKFPFPLLITASGYIDKYGPAERYNILRFADRLTCPTVFFYGSRELEQGGIAFRGMPEALRMLPGAERREVRTIDGADHFYAGTAELLAGGIGQWLTATFS
jgi:pimeloyl-ACP methyl ester carboxylesterase